MALFTQILFILAYSVCLLAGWYIYGYDRGRPLNQRGAAVMFLLASWALVELFISIAQDAAQVDLLSQIHSTLSILVVTMTMFMVLRFDEVQSVLPAKMRRLIMLPSIIGIVILLIFIWVYDGNPDYNFRKVDGFWVYEMRDNDPIAWLMVSIYAYAIIVFAVALIYGIRRNWHRANRVKNKVFLVVFTMIPGFITFFYVYLPITYGSAPNYTMSIPSALVGLIYVTLLARLHFFEISPLVAANRIMEVLPGVAVLTDTKFIVTHINSYLRKQMAMQQSDIIGLPVWEVVDRVDPVAQQVNLDNIRQLEEGRQFVGEFTFEIKGNKLDVLLTAAPVFRRGRKAGYIFIIMDITRMKEGEAQLMKYAKQLEKTNKELAQFAYIVSHDIKSPLRNIISFSQLLGLKVASSELAADKDVKAYQDFIDSNSRYLFQLVEDILEYSQLKEEPLRSTPVDIGLLLESIRLSMSADMHQRDAALHIPHTLPVIQASQTLLRQLFQNLISNAIRYNRSPQPCVTILYELAAERTHLFSIEDNGIGIAPEHHEKVFDMFRRLHHQREFQGTGIGLAICKKIAELYGGEIWLESEMGRGSTFYVRIKEPAQPHCEECAARDESASA